MDCEDLFEPYDELIELEILGEKHLVPENNNLLRCFQFVSMRTISFGNFCWNGECLNCRVKIEVGGARKFVISCRTKIAANMKVVEIGREIKFQ